MLSESYVQLGRELRFGYYSTSTKFSTAVDLLLPIQRADTVPMGKNNSGQ
jgi:hypothetical protein